MEQVQNSSSKGKGLMKKIISTIGKGLAFIPLVILLTIAIPQFKTIHIEGKGDTGHERSVRHPFICNTGFFTDRGTFYYCDFKTFSNDVVSGDLKIWFPVLIWVQIYLGLLIVISPMAVVGSEFWKRKNSERRRFQRLFN